MTRILFFGRLRDVAGHGERDIDLPDEVATIADLRAWIGRDDAVLGDALRCRSIRACVDHVISIDDNASVKGAEEIAFMPPLSGG